MPVLFALFANEVEWFAHLVTLIALTTIPSIFSPKWFELEEADDVLWLCYPILAN
jgi:hypothetical protein